MANQDGNVSSQEFEPATKPVKASLLDNPYLLGVALVSYSLLSILQDVDRRTVCITRWLPLWV